MLEFGSMAGLFASLLSVFLVFSEETLFAESSFLAFLSTFVASLFEESFLAVFAEFLSTLIGIKSQLENQGSNVQVAHLLLSFLPSCVLPFCH